jgi:hypothetical protein
MPRLLGKSSKAPLYIGTALAIAVAGVATIEYLGVIDVIPDFGKERKTAGQLKPSKPHTSNSNLENNF